MKALIIVLALLLVLFLIAMIKLGVSIVYRDNKLSIRIIAAGFRLKLGQKKKDKQKRGKKNADPEQKKEKPKFEAKPWIRSALNHWTELMAMIGRVLTSPTIEKLRVYISVGDEDPEKCAMDYGRLCAIVGSILAPLENTFKIKKRDVEINNNFFSTKNCLEAEAVLAIRVYAIVALAAAALRIVIRIYREVKYSKKVVLNNESSSS